MGKVYLKQIEGSKKLRKLFNFVQPTFPKKFFS